MQCGAVRTAKKEGSWSYKYGLVDRTGKEILPCEYDAIDEWADTDLIRVRKDGKSGFISITKDPATNTAYPSTQKVDVDGKQIEFQCYALKDANGYDTNYIKLRDLADILNGSAAQFEVNWNGNVTITTGQSYTPNGSEQKTPFSGQRAYKTATAQTLVDGKAVDLAAFTLNDDNGGGYTYYKLRDLGNALGIKVDWTAERGIFIETK